MIGETPTSSLPWPWTCGGHGLHLAADALADATLRSASWGKKQNQHHIIKLKIILICSRHKPRKTFSYYCSLNKTLSITINSYQGNITGIIGTALTFRILSNKVCKPFHSYSWPLIWGKLQLFTNGTLSHSYTTNIAGNHCGRYRHYRYRHYGWQLTRSHLKLVPLKPVSHHPKAVNRT